MSRRYQASKRDRIFSQGKVRKCYQKDDIFPVVEDYNRGFTLQVGQVITARVRGQKSTNLGYRPFVVINSGGTDNIVEVVPLTKSHAKYKYHIMIIDGCLKVPSVALCDNIQTIDKCTVTQCWGKLEKENFNRIIKTRRRILSDSLKLY